MKLLKRWLYRFVFRKERHALLEAGISYNVNWSSTASSAEATGFEIAADVRQRH